MTFFDAALLLLGQLPKYLAEMLAKVATKHLPAALEDKNNVAIQPASLLDGKDNCLKLHIEGGNN
jgi:hypothetical protein